MDARSPLLQGRLSRAHKNLNAAEKLFGQFFPQTGQGLASLASAVRAPPSVGARALFGPDARAMGGLVSLFPKKDGFDIFIDIECKQPAEQASAGRTQVAGSWTTAPRAGRSQQGAMQTDPPRALAGKGQDAKGAGADPTTAAAVQKVLERNADVLRLVTEYKDCKDLCAQAITNSTKENELAAFEALLQPINAIIEIKAHTQALAGAVGKIIGSANPAQLDKQPALMRMLAQLLAFMVEFDRNRSACFRLSNDFAFYRRLLPKFPRHERIKLGGNEASAMAFFTAQTCPMMLAVKEALSEQDETAETILRRFINSGVSSLAKKAFESKDTNLLLAQALTGAMVLFDNITASGVFAKNSKIMIKEAVKLIKREFEVPQRNQLLDAIRYFSDSSHFRAAPSGVQNLFDTN